MSFKVHRSVENTRYFNAILANPKQYRMSPGKADAAARMNVIPHSPLLWLGHDAFKGIPDLADVTLGLIAPPSVCGIGKDFTHVI